MFPRREDPKRFEFILELLTVLPDWLSELLGKFGFINGWSPPLFKSLLVVWIRAFDKLASGLWRFWEGLLLWFEGLSKFRLLKRDLKAEFELEMGFLVFDQRGLVWTVPLVLSLGFEFLVWVLVAVLFWIDVLAFARLQKLYRDYYWVGSRLSVEEEMCGNFE